jgi:hypothetical protein
MSQMNSFTKGNKKRFNTSHINTDEELNKICEICNYACFTKLFQKNFKYWTSNNDDIDRFIQDTQLSSHKDVKEALEWIPYYNLYDINYIAGNRCRANWVDGYMINWDSENENWQREGQNISVELKRLNHPKSISSEFMKEVLSFIKIFHSSLFFLIHYIIIRLVKFTE